MSWTIIFDLVALIVACAAAFILGTVNERRRALLAPSDVTQEINAMRAILMAEIGYIYRLETNVHAVSDVLRGLPEHEEYVANSLDIMESRPPIETLLESVEAKDWHSFEILSQGQSFRRAAK